MSRRFPSFVKLLDPVAADLVCRLIHKPFIGPRCDHHEVCASKVSTQLRTASFCLRLGGAGELHQAPQYLKYC